MAIKPLDLARTDAGVGLAARIPAGLPGPESLIGLADMEVEAVLGPPEFRRLDGPAQIWRYRGGNCMVDLYLYAGGTGGTAAFRVDHVGFRGTDVAQVDPRLCYAGLFGPKPAT